MSTRTEVRTIIEAYNTVIFERSSDDEETATLSINPGSNPVEAELEREDARVLAQALFDFANKVPLVNPGTDRHQAFPEVQL